ncbi:hypothetical protein ABZP36_008371 [Zizania latifolia]
MMAAATTHPPYIFHGMGGHLTWEWKHGLRSYLHPLIFAALYKIMALLHLDTPWFMVMAPYLLQSVSASFGDLYLYKLSKLIFNNHVVEWTLFSQRVNWFMFFCITRTLSNSLKTVLTVTGLYYWFVAIEFLKVTSAVPKQHAASKQSPPSRKIALLIAALACAIRRTSAITWLYVGLLDFIQMNMKSKKSKSHFLFLEVIPISVIVLSVTTFLDCWMYGSQGGTEDVMFYLSQEAHDGGVKSVLFLMPCHSTPYYST